MKEVGGKEMRGSRQDSWIVREEQETDVILNKI